MRHVGYVKIQYIIEKVNREKPNRARYNIPDLKEWIWEAVQKIGGEIAFVRSTVRLKVEERQVRIPSEIRYIKEVRNGDGSYLTETRDSFADSTEDTLKYIINDRYLFTSFDTEELIMEVLKFPVDDKGDPMVVDNETVLQAVISYILERISRKMWINELMPDNKYRAVEQEWLFYVNAASQSLNIPSLDGMEEWRFLSMLPPLKDSRIGAASNGTGYEEPPFFND